MNIFIANIIGKRAELTAEESWHCARVLRKKTGDPVHLIDGKGNFFEGVLELVTDRACHVNITKGPSAEPESPYYLHLCIAPTKQIDRVEWMLEKAVEIGVQEISFMICHNSERKMIKSERIQKIIESAVKQSLQARLPLIHEPLSFKDLVSNTKADQKLIAHCFDGPRKNIRTVDFKNKNTLVLIGPEGDFTIEEVEMSRANGFEGLNLGQHRLRTETAALYVCQAASLLSG